MCAYEDGFLFLSGARVIGAALSLATSRQRELASGRREGGRKSSAIINQLNLI
jgi:hypothetical protein